MQIALFITCLTDQFLPRAGIATVKVLEHLGHRVVFPAAQTCCGQPMFNNGFHEDARAVAARMVDVFEPFECVVTPSGSCAAMIREHFATLLAGTTIAGHARALAAKTYEFVEFLTKVEEVNLRELGVAWAGTATYHYSCHLRALGMSDEAIRLISQIRGLEFTPLPRAEQCCGFGGTFAVKYPRISGAMVNDKVEAVRSTGTAHVVCNDAGCAMNLAGACNRQSCPVEFISLAEIIAEGLSLMPREALS